jgi:hypothetical protein
MHENMHKKLFMLCFGSFHNTKDNETLKRILVNNPLPNTKKYWNLIQCELGLTKELIHGSIPNAILFQDIHKCTIKFFNLQL